MTKQENLGGAVLLAMVATVLLSLFLLTRCTPLPDPEPPLVDPWEGGLPPRPDPSGCPGACARLLELGCPEAEPTPGPDGVLGNADDGTCEAICRNVEESATVTLNTACVAKAASCEAASDCQR